MYLVKQPTLPSSSIWHQRKLLPSVNDRLCLLVSAWMFSLDPEFRQSTIKQIAGVDNIERHVIGRHETINPYSGLVQYLSRSTFVTVKVASRRKTNCVEQTTGGDNRTRIAVPFISGIFDDGLSNHMSRTLTNGTLPLSAALDNTLETYSLMRGWAATVRLREA